MQPDWSRFISPRNLDQRYSFAAKNYLRSQRIHFEFDPRKGCMRRNLESHDGQFRRGGDKHVSDEIGMKRTKRTKDVAENQRFETAHPEEGQHAAAML